MGKKCSPGPAGSSKKAIRELFPAVESWQTGCSRRTPGACSSRARRCSLMPVRGRSKGDTWRGTTTLCRTCTADTRLLWGRGGPRWQYHGSLWSDTKTLDVTRLRVVAENIPPVLGLLDADLEIEYQSIQIGRSEALLPKRADIVLTH